MSKNPYFQMSERNEHSCSFSSERRKQGYLTQKLTSYTLLFPYGNCPLIGSFTSHTLAKVLNESCAIYPTHGSRIVDTQNVVKMCLKSLTRGETVRGTVARPFEMRKHPKGTQPRYVETVPQTVSLAQNFTNRKTVSQTVLLLHILCAFESRRVFRYALITL